MTLVWIGVVVAVFTALATVAHHDRGIPGKVADNVLSVLIIGAFLVLMAGVAYKLGIIGPVNR
jgi:hypothetical protein